MTEIDKKRLGSWDKKILRRTYGPVGEQGIWSISTNQEMRELYKYQDVLAGFKKKRMEWIGHMVRIDQGGQLKNILE